MTLKILVDECILDKLLDAKLRAAGHDVQTVTEAGLTSKSDQAIFDAAIASDRMILTINCSDFVELAHEKVDSGSSHPGVLLVYRFNEPSKELSHDKIVKAITNLEATGIELKNRCHKLNDYNY